MVANEVPELNQGDAIIRAVDVDGVEELSRLHAPAFDQVNELLDGGMFEGDIAAAFRTRAHDMGFATDIIGLQRVLVLSVGDIVSTVLVKDVLKAVDLGLGQPQIASLHTGLELISSDVSGVSHVTDTEEGFGSEVLGLELDYELCQGHLLRVRFLGLAPLRNLLLALLAQHRDFLVGSIHPPVTGDLKQRRDCLPYAN